MSIPRAPKLPQSHSEVIKLWPTFTAFQKATGLNYFTGRAMYQRNSISGEHWPLIADCCIAIGRPDITIAVLANLHKRKTRTTRHPVEATASPQ